MLYTFPLPRTYRLPRCLLLLALVAGTGAGLRGQTTIDYQVTPAVSGSKNNGSGLIGQSFTASSGATALDSLTLYINRSGLGTVDFTLSLYAVTGTDNAWAPTGSALYSATFSNAILAATVDTSYTFSDLNWSITGDTTYLVAIEGSSPTAVKWQNSGDTGTWLIGTGTQNRYQASDGTTDASKRYAMTVTTSAVPEPGTYAMIMALLVGGVTLRRRKHTRSRL